MSTEGIILTILAVIFLVWSFSRPARQHRRWGDDTYRDYPGDESWHPDGGPAEREAAEQRRREIREAEMDRPHPYR